MPTAHGWKDGRVPTAAAGLSVNAFISNLEHPRWIYVLPNNDVLVAEAMEQAGEIKTPFDYAIHATMKRASAVGVSANRISLHRDTTGNGVADVHEYFVEDQLMPFGMELIDGTFYIGNTNGIVSYMSSILNPVSREFLHRACAMLSVWPGSRTPVSYGP